MTPAPITRVTPATTRERDPATRVAGGRGKPDAVGDGTGSGSARVGLAWNATVAILAAVLVAEAVASLGWRMAHDGPILAYAAHAMNRFGLVPYRDLFEFNLPGTYAFFAVWDRLPGPMDFKFRALDVGVLAATLAGVVRLLAPFGTRAGLLAASLYGLTVLRFGAAVGLQRELIALPAIVWACVAAAEHRRLGLARSWLLAGLGFGLAAAIKPTLAIGLPVACAWAWRDRDPGARPASGWRPALGAAAMALAPLAAGIGWVAALGGLPAMIETFRDYVPLYLSLDEQHRVVSAAERGRQALLHLARFGGFAGWWIPIAAGLLLARGVPRVEPPDRAARLRLLAMLVAAYAVQPVLSGQYWVYHALPLACFLTAWAAAACTRATTRGAGASALALLCLWGAITLELRPPRAFVDQLRGQAPPAPNGGVVDAIVEPLRPRLQPGDTIQPLDWTGGAVHAMLRLDARPATRYLYDFSFYHHPETGVVRALRSDVVRRLTSAPPRFVIRILDTARPTGPGTTDRFPELEALLAERYRAFESRPEYILYERH